MTDPRFSASVAGRYMACPASANLEVAIPYWTPPEVDEMAGAKGRGTTLHEILEPLMRLGGADFQQLAMIIAYVAEVRRRRRFQVLVEHSVQADWLDTKPWTTADLVLHTADELHILDFKFGKIPVEVVDNEQLMYYALCYAHLSPKAKEAHLHILQPAAKNMEEWVVDSSELLRFQNKARISEQLIIAKDTTFGPSDHCTFCPANPHSRGDKGKPLCPAMMGMLYPPIVDEQAVLDA